MLVMFGLAVGAESRMMHGGISQFPDGNGVTEKFMSFGESEERLCMAFQP